MYSTDIEPRTVAVYTAGFGNSTAACSCGWSGSRRLLRAAAYQDAWGHAAQNRCEIACPLVLAVTRPLRRLLPAAFIVAAAATLSAGAFGDPPTACAQPKKPFNQEGYSKCVEQVIDDWKAGEYTDEQKNELVRGCCILAGGKMEESGARVPQQATAPAREIPSDLPTQTLTPYPLTVRPGSITQTFAPVP